MVGKSFKADRQLEKQNQLVDHKLKLRMNFTLVFLNSLTLNVPSKAEIVQVGQMKVMVESQFTHIVFSFQ